MNTPPRVEAPAHRNAPRTSHDAARAIEGVADTLRAKVWALLRERGEYGATDQELQDALGLPSNTQIPRRWELVNAGDVIASKRTRKTRAGRRATVWVLREHAPELNGGAQ